jgi:hypothetical protein
MAKKESEHRAIDVSKSFPSDLIAKSDEVGSYVIDSE